MKNPSMNTLGKILLAVLTALSVAACDRPTGSQDPWVGDVQNGTDEQYADAQNPLANPLSDAGDANGADDADETDVYIPPAWQARQRQQVAVRYPGRQLDPRYAPQQEQPAYRPAARSAVVINGQPLTDQELMFLQTRCGIQARPGRYWYDRACGAWGHGGGPTVAFALPGIPVGGRMREDASNGNTGVFVNGRELPMQDVRALQQITEVRRGRWWVDAQGNAGPEGGYAVINLRQAAARASGNRYGSVHGTGGYVATDENGQHMFMGSNGESWWSGK